VTISQAARGLIDCIVLLTTLLDNAALREVDDAVVGTTGLPFPTMNGVWAASVPPSPRWVDQHLDDIASTGLSYCLQLPVTAPPEFMQAAVARGMVHEDDIPLMEMADLNTSSVPPSGTPVTFRALTPDRYREYSLVAADAFGAPPEIFEQFVTTRVVADPAITVLVGEVDGTPVTTGMSMTMNDRTGIFGIATPEPYRRRGYGAAVTAALIDDARARGAESAFLQSSQAGLGVYQRLGFRTVDVWQCWVLPAHVSAPNA
jgi:ribosomal protein S18 acetylase RimI-like enzyme